MPSNHAIEIQSLPTSLDPLIAYFNAGEDKLRVLTILSPMCPR